MNVQSLVLAIALAAFATPAIAADSDELGDGTSVTVRAQVKTSAAKVRAKLRHMEFRRKISPEVLDMTAVDQGGSCEKIWVKFQGLFESLEYHAKRCETADGFVETLLDSKDLSAYESRWLIDETDEGASVTVHMTLKLRRKIPQRLLDMGVKRGLKKTLRIIGEELDE